MICPSCKAPMVILEFERIEIDYCAECGGVWFDTGELELLLEGTSNKPLFKFGGAGKTTEKRLRCPRCLKRMAKTRSGSEKAGLIDRCVNGHGIWLDKGELEKIAAGGDQTDRIRKFLAGIFAVEKASRNKSNPEGDGK